MLLTGYTSSIQTIIFTFPKSVRFINFDFVYKNIWKELTKEDISDISYQMIFVLRTTKKNETRNEIFACTMMSDFCNEILFE